MHFCRVRALCVIWNHNLLQLVNGALHSTQKRFIVQIKSGCHQQHATLHDASRITHVTCTYLLIGHGHQNSSNSHTKSSPPHSVYIHNNNNNLHTITATSFQSEGKLKISSYTHSENLDYSFPCKVFR